VIPERKIFCSFDGLTRQERRERWYSEFGKEDAGWWYQYEAEAGFVIHRRGRKRIREATYVFLFNGNPLTDKELLDRILKLKNENLDQYMKLKQRVKLFSQNTEESRSVSIDITPEDLIGEALLLYKIIVYLGDCEDIKYFYKEGRCRKYDALFVKEFVEGKRDKVREPGNSHRKVIPFYKSHLELHVMTLREFHIVAVKLGLFPSGDKALQKAVVGDRGTALSDHFGPIVSEICRRYLI
jgi:hypothetical protein